jgi:hypothetical protein
MNVQYITNGKGKPSGVYIPIEDWELIKKELESKSELPEWHNEILNERQEKYLKGKSGFAEAEVVLKEIESRL